MSHPEPLVIVVFGLAGLLVALQLWLHWPRRRRPPRTGFDATFRAAGRGAARQRQVASRRVPPPRWQEEPPESAPPAESPQEGPP